MAFALVDYCLEPSKQLSYCEPRTFAGYERTKIVQKAERGEAF